MYMHPTLVYYIHRLLKTACALAFLAAGSTHAMGIAPTDEPKILTPHLLEKEKRQRQAEIEQTKQRHEQERRKRQAEHEQRMADLYTQRQEQQKQHDKKMAISTQKLQEQIAAEQEEYDIATQPIWTPAGKKRLERACNEVENNVLSFFGIESTEVTSEKKQKSTKSQQSTTVTEQKQSSFTTPRSQSMQQSEPASIEDALALVDQKWERELHKLEEQEKQNDQEHEEFKRLQAQRKAECEQSWQSFKQNYPHLVAQTEVELQPDRKETEQLEKKGEKLHAQNKASYPQRKIDMEKAWKDERERVKQRVKQQKLEDQKWHKIEQKIDHVKKTVEDQIERDEQEMMKKYAPYKNRKHAQCKITHSDNTPGATLMVSLISLWTTHKQLLHKISALSTYKSLQKRLNCALNGAAKAGLASSMYTLYQIIKTEGNPSYNPRTQYNGLTVFGTYLLLDLVHAYGGDILKGILGIHKTIDDDTHDSNTQHYGYDHENNTSENHENNVSDALEYQPYYTMMPDTMPKNTHQSRIVGAISWTIKATLAMCCAQVKT